MSKYSFTLNSANKLEEAVLEDFRRRVKGAPDDLSKEEMQSLDPEYFAFIQSSMKEAEKAGYSNYSYWGSTLRMFFKNKVGVTTFVILIILIGFSLIQPFLPNQKSPTQIYNQMVLRPNGRWYEQQIRNHGPFQGLSYFGTTNDGTEIWENFVFGTNNIGQDLWARIWSGTRTSLRIGVTVGFVSILIGISIGMMWGYIRPLDWFFTELYNVINNIPSTIILILASFLMRPSVGTIIFAMCIYTWLNMGRLVRNLTMMLRDREFNLASRCLGTSVFKIIFRNLLPQMVSIITLNFALAIPGAINSEVFLSYLGLGVDVNTPSLGNLLNAGRALMMSPALRYQLLIPAAVLCVITISFYLMGNAFSDSADPRNHV
ncbi:MAG: ABC transporter permease [Defluviitaleaceae bacterium]|nr:ABC transporter permease [Defluviitaleaceae bacterium]MCL2836408.1 ABC transporter permease [Defluviitaleaceae bacterium]